MKRSKFTIIDDSFISSSDTGVSDKTQLPTTYNTKTEIYKAINNIYKSFQMTKTNQFENYGVYKARVECYICSDNRYIVAIVENDNDSIGTVKPLTELNWISFQTRIIKTIDEFKRFNMFPKSYSLPTKSILNDKIIKIGETKEKSVYQTENLPLDVEILHLNENETFQDKGTVIAALEMYQTVITFNE